MIIKTDNDLKYIELKVGYVTKSLMVRFCLKSRVNLNQYKVLVQLSIVLSKKLSSTDWRLDLINRS